MQTEIQKSVYHLDQHIKTTKREMMYRQQHKTSKDIKPDEKM